MDSTQHEPIALLNNELMIIPIVCLLCEHSERFYETNEMLWPILRTSRIVIDGASLVKLDTSTRHQSATTGAEQPGNFFENIIVRTRQL